MMIEIVIMDHLKINLDSKIGIGLERPITTPDSFIIFEKTSSGEDNQIHSATFAFQSYSKKSLYEAAKLNEDLKAIIKKMDELPSVLSVKLNTDYNFTDTSTKEYRYQAVFDFKY